MRLPRSVASVLFVLLILTFAATAFAQISVGISVNFGPPALPVYDQPLCPGDGYIWTPGYWAWDNDGDDYYWVPGTWVTAPEVGYLWTPPWWGWENNAFFFHDGYWGPQVGFYGGISYGFGYFGHGYEGGRWQGDHFYYNREVNNINVTNIRNVYNERVTIHNENHVSYNGHGGIDARPSPQEEAAMHERHIGPVGAQTEHIQAARGNRELRASENHGRPPIAATARPGGLHEGAVPAKSAGGAYNPPANRGRGSGPDASPGRGAESSASRGNNSYVHPHDLPAINRPAPTNTGDVKRDQKYQQQQEKMYAKQNQEREKLQARQDKEHQQLAKQNANDARKQQVEQRHQQQTQQLSQKHEQQQQHMQTRSAPPPSHEQGGKPH